MTIEYTGTWYGVPIEELPRDDLLDVIKFCSKEIAELKAERNRLFAAVDLSKYLLNGTRNG